ncbi:MAG: hypothetical protein HC919_03940 [Oscillatoriales cyanobacterium SM2_2_1]|nr:hypothetical protein [Oscillatoriales cyanobacterium SM2_2_1]
MLFPVKRQKLDELIPAVPTAEQYQYCWGSGREVVTRGFISLGALIIFTLFYNRVHEISPSSPAAAAMLVCGILGGLYWMLQPVLAAAQRNLRLRRFPFCALWLGEVQEVYLSEEVLSRQEVVDGRGRLDVSYDTATFLNLEVGDESGFETTLRVPMRREFKRIRPGMMLCLLLFSKDKSFQRISRQMSDAYFPEFNFWLGDYPYLQRGAFADLARFLWKRHAQ